MAQICRYFRTSFLSTTKKLLTRHFLVFNFRQKNPTVKPSRQKQYSVFWLFTGDPRNMGFVSGSCFRGIIFRPVDEKEMIKKSSLKKMDDNHISQFSPQEIDGTEEKRLVALLRILIWRESPLLGCIGRTTLKKTKTKKNNNFKIAAK